MKKGQIMDPEREAWSEWVSAAKLFKDLPVGTVFRSEKGGKVQIKTREPQEVRTPGCMMINARPVVLNRQKPWAGQSEYGAHVRVREVLPDEIPVPCGAD